MLRSGLVGCAWGAGLLTAHDRARMCKGWLLWGRHGCRPLIGPRSARATMFVGPAPALGDSPVASMCGPALAQAPQYLTRGC